jgi:hypothetical protein
MNETKKQMETDLGKKMAENLDLREVIFDKDGNEHTFAEVLSVLEDNLFDLDSAIKELNISKSKIVKLIHANKVWRKLFRDSMITEAELQLMNNIKKGFSKDIHFALKTLEKQTYSEQQNINLDINDKTSDEIKKDIKDLFGIDDN